ncbi:hypothetical protein [Streptomyces tendae]
MQLHDTPILDEHWQGFELGRDDEFRYVWIWYGFNIRLIALYADGLRGGYEHGWCYPRDPGLVAQAVAAWARHPGRAVGLAQAGDLARPPSLPAQRQPPVQPGALRTRQLLPRRRVPRPQLPRHP